MGRADAPPETIAAQIAVDLAQQRAAVAGVDISRAGVDPATRIGTGSANIEIRVAVAVHVVGTRH
jgi:hypothetical protein